MKIDFKTVKTGFIKWIKGLPKKIAESDIFVKVKKGIINFIGSIITNFRHYIIPLIIIAISGIIWIILNIVTAKEATKAPGQSVNLNWGDGTYAQVACFSEKEDGFEIMDLLKFEYDLKTDLENAGHTAEKDKQKMYTSCYSSKSKISVYNNGVSVDGTAYGVGGDFFGIHQLELVGGGYIDTTNVMKDFILLDAEAAWQLYGSYDIAGKPVYIYDEKFVVAGVYKRPEDKYNKASGNGEITYYVNYEALEKIDGYSPITSYEIIGKNPVKQYLYDFANKYFMEVNENGEPQSDRNLKIIETSERFALPKLFNRLKNFPTNSMDTDTIQYPYWENVARAYEDLLVLILVFRIMCGVVIFISVIVEVIIIVKDYKKYIRA